MFAEDDLVPLSALQHLLYCPRQCALIHVERLWAENSFTLEGRHLHEKADAGRAERRGGVRIARSLPLRSLLLGLIGNADVVEFHSSEPGSAPFPVEYKRGRPKKQDADRVQLCAQAICLEEMLKVAVPAGALFYGKTRRRIGVSFDAQLRGLTKRTAEQLHELIASNHTPPPTDDDARCKRCSLRSLCLPDCAMPSKSAARYLQRSIRRALADSPPEDERL